MLHYPHFNPIAFTLGPLKVHWYGLMYLFGFAMTLLLGTYRARKPWTPVNTLDEVSDALFYGALGVILGGRIGYMLFYDLPNFIHAPWIIIRVWDGGMSFHGGLIGVCLMFWWYAKKKGLPLLALTDFYAPMVPIGLGAGRLGNFINGNLWGRITTSPLGMVFPKGGPLPRYPSQLLEFSLEGVFLFVFLWLFSRKPRAMGLTSAWFLILYGVVRIFAEFFREPDPQLGFIAFGWVTMGMALSAPMVILGILLFIRSKKKNQLPPYKKSTGAPT